MQHIIESSFTVRISSAFRFMIAKVISLRDVSNPSATVTGLTEGAIMPVLNDFQASFAFKGSAR
jgi:hypothetical protein